MEYMNITDKLSSKNGITSRVKWADTSPSDGHCSGRYASYWKAFLFTHNFTQIMFNELYRSHLNIIQM